MEFPVAVLMAYCKQRHRVNQSVMGAGDGRSSHSRRARIPRGVGATASLLGVTSKRALRFACPAGLACPSLGGLTSRQHVLGCAL